MGAATTEAQENVALQVAEQIADYVLSGAITNALNTASVTAEEAPKLKPFVALCDKLGAFAGQIVDDGLEAIEIEYEGDVTGLNMKPLTACLLAGILKPLLADINMVNAPTILKDRGTPFTESKRDLSPTFDSLIRVKVQTGGKWRTVAGAVIGGQPRIVEIKGMALEAPFHPIMLFINNSDTPGFIGALGMKLGGAGINIATFNLGRVAEGEDAIALVGIDQAIPANVEAELKALPQVRYVKQLSF